MKEKTEIKEKIKENHRPIPMRNLYAKILANRIQQYFKRIMTMIYLRNASLV